MEFHEKLQELRKNRGVTQEELAEELYVSRTAVSKWESGRGYPSIDSLKAISNYFSVSIDDLLSAEKIISIAEKESQFKIQRICDLLIGMIDVCTFLLIVLPLYPNEIQGYIYSVNLLSYTGGTSLIRFAYWIMFVTLMLDGVIKVLLAQLKIEKGQKTITKCSVSNSVLAVLLLAMTREAYATILVFLLLVIKTLILVQIMRGENRFNKR